MSNNALLNNIISIAQKAGVKILEIYNSNDFSSAVEYKEDNSKEGYFNIVYIENFEDYNNIILKNYHSNIATINLEYPFYIVESVEKPGWCVNIKYNNNIPNVSIEPCNNQATERFHVSIEPSNNYSEDCPNLN